MWRQKIIDNGVLSFDFNCQWEKHPDLDDMPKKSIGEQVRDVIMNNDVMENSRLQALNALGVDGDVDPDSVDDVDEYADLYDIDKMIEELKVSRETLKKELDEKKVLSRQASVGEDKQVSSDSPPVNQHTSSGDSLGGDAQK